MKLATIPFAHTLFLVAILFIAPGGCTSLPAAFQGDQGQPLTASSYAAADMLLQQSHASINTQTPLHIGVLTDMQDPAALTAFGQIIASHIGARFVQLGYNVTMTSYDEMMLMKEQAAQKAVPGAGMQSYAQGGDTGTGSEGQQKVMITGQYAVARNQVLVNLRLVNPTTGRLLAAYDYTMPKTSDIRSLTKKDSEEKGFFSL